VVNAKAALNESIKIDKRLNQLNMRVIELIPVLGELKYTAAGHQHIRYICVKRN